MQEGAAVSGVFLMIDREREGPLYRALKATPVVAAVSSQNSTLESFRKTMAENLVIMIWFYSMFAGLIAFGVVYNSARISLSERGRELASLRVMGFTRFEVSYILLGELAVLTVLALPLGCAIGYGLAALMVKSFDTELYRLPLVIWPSTYGYAMLVVVVAALVSDLLVRRRIDNLDLVSVLKTRE
jgi:putative ABC transport system permease protein